LGKPHCCPFMGDYVVHLRRISLIQERYPTRKYYPFNQEILWKTRSLEFVSPVTFFVGENGSGKSTLLEAIAHKCRIHLWKDRERISYENNPYEDHLYRFMEAEWTDGPVPGSFFSSEFFHHFVQNLDEWAASDPGMLAYFGGKSLNAQSHGQSLMAFFRSRYRIRGLYLLDEPETALSPRSQLMFVKLVKEMSLQGHAQFIIATHSPILLACPGARIYSFDEVPVKEVPYEATEHYRLYKGFMNDREQYL
jgi:predicted ATPase